MNAFNRVALVVIALVMIAAGVVGILTNQDWLGQDTVSSAIPFRDAWEGWRDVDWGDSAWQWALLGGAALVFLLALALLARELLIRPSFGRERVTLQSTPRGQTTIRVRALESTLARQAADQPGVQSARVGDLDLEGPTPRLALELTTDPNVELVGAGNGAADAVAESLATTLERPTAVVTTRVAVGRDQRQERRVQ